MSKEIERRLWKGLELRSVDAGGGKRKLSGYAAVYDQRSDLLGNWFVEIVRPGAFANSLRSADVRCLFNHDPSLILGRTMSGTLRLRDDSRGLFMECDLPETSVATDLARSVDRGDVNQQSFSFRTVQDRWTFSDKANEPTLRELLEVEIYDVSPVTFPAYPQTDVGVRELEPTRRCFEEAKKAHLAARGMPLRMAELALEEAEG